MERVLVVDDEEGIRSFISEVLEGESLRVTQAPDGVRDYLIIHEPMHRREMNHSIRFWRHVAHACSRWREAEAWLDRHAVELGF